MTQDEIIRMARGLTNSVGSHATPCIEGADMIEAFYNLVAAHEREKQAEQEPVGYWQGKFSQDGGAVLYEVPQASAFGYHYPNYPVYAAPQPDYKALWEQMCKRCDELDLELAKYTEQEPVAWMDLHKELGQLRWAGKDIGWDLAIDAVRNRLEELYAAPVQPVKQEPVAIMSPNKANIVGINTPYANIGTDDWIKLYAAPVSIEAAVLAEREACAKVCDDLHHWAASCCAKDIRARGE